MHLPPYPPSDPASFSHTVVVVVVVVAATILKFNGHIDTPTVSAVYVGSLGYATGLAGRKSEHGGYKDG